jgi:FMN-dependent NADH-azoreductase
MKILHLDSSPTGASSVSREVSKATVAHLAARHPSAEVTYRDLTTAPIGHLGPDLLNALRPGDAFILGPQFAGELELTEELIAEFLVADVVVIGAPMINFSVPTQLKAWIDRVAQPGRTFKYTETGPIGLAAGKKVILVSSRGGMYAGTPMEQTLDHQEAYMRAVMGFFGISDVEVIRAEGVAYGPDARARAVSGALEHAAAM